MIMHKAFDKPVYLDKAVKEFFIHKLRHHKDQPFSVNETVNVLLKKDIEIYDLLTH